MTHFASVILDCLDPPVMPTNLSSFSATPKNMSSWTGSVTTLTQPIPWGNEPCAEKLLLYVEQDHLEDGFGHSLHITEKSSWANLLDSISPMLGPSASLSSNITSICLQRSSGSIKYRWRTSTTWMKKVVNWEGGKKQAHINPSSHVTGE